MPSSYFGGNKSGSGAALFVTFSSKDQCAYFKVVKQTAWNAQTAKASFAGGAVINVKLSADEVAEFIHSVNNHDSNKFYHKFNSDVTSGSFSYYEKDGANGGKMRGFGLTVKKGEVEARMGFSIGSAQRLCEYLRFALDHMHSAIYSQDKKEQEEYFKKRDAAANPVTTKTKAVEKVKEVEEVESEEAPPEVVEEDTVVW